MYRVHRVRMLSGTLDREAPPGPSSQAGVGRLRSGGVQGSKHTHAHAHLVYIFNLFGLDLESLRRGSESVIQLGCGIAQISPAPKGPGWHVPASGMLSSASILEGSDIATFFLCHCHSTGMYVTLQEDLVLTLAHFKNISHLFWDQHQGLVGSGGGNG